jgi:hypothetical protein
VSKKSMRIKKAKVTGEGRIVMIWEEANIKGGWDEYQLNCRDNARPTFYTRLQDLAQHVIEICELPVELNRVNVKGVSVSYGGDKEVMGATITAEYKLENSVCGLNLNTPHKASESYSDAPADPMQLLSDDCIEALEDFYDECYAYISGDRERMSLFDELKNMPEFQDMAALVKSGEVEISVH